MKSDKLFNATYSLIIGLSFTLIAIIILIGKEWIYSNIIDLLILGIFFVSIKDIVNFFIGSKKKRKINFYKSVIGLTFGILFSIFKNIPLSILPIAFGIYLSLNSIIKITNVIILFENKSRGKIKGIISFLLDFIIGISCILSPLKNLRSVLIILSVYLLLLGMSYIKDFITNLLPLKVKDKIRRKTRVSLPAIVEAIIPYTVLNEINYEIDKKNMDEEFIYDEKKNDVIPDMEVLVHISNRGFNRLGHCDIVYDNKVISYGSYDKKTLKYHDLIADG